MGLLSIGLRANAQSIEQKILMQAHKEGINPKLALAIAKTESNLNPKARGSKGEIGLFQIMPKTYPGVYLVDTDKNIKYGVKLLAKYKKQCKDMGDAWFVCYNNGPNRRPRYPYWHPYYKRVMFAMRSL